MSGYASTDPLTGGNVNSGKSPTFPTSLCKSKANSFRRSLKSQNKTEVATVMHKVTLIHRHFLDLSSPPASVRFPQWKPDLKYMKEIRELPRGKLTKSRKDDNNRDTQGPPLLLQRRHPAVNRPAVHRPLQLSQGGGVPACGRGDHAPGTVPESPRATQQPSTDFYSTQTSKWKLCCGHEES